MDENTSLSITDKLDLVELGLTHEHRQTRLLQLSAHLLRLPEIVETSDISQIVDSDMDDVIRDEILMTEG